MLDDLTKTFFDTFGIEPKKGCTAYDKLEEREADTICNDECLECLYFDDRYPQITDRILLELICIIAKELNCFTNYLLTYEHLKEYILKEMILEKDNFTKSQVQALFKE